MLMVASELGSRIHPAWVLFFVGMLLAIAVLPLATPHWFEHLRNKAIVAAILGTPVIIYLIVRHGSEGTHAVLGTLEEYISFIVYIAALFVIAGGIYISGDTKGSPKTNIVFMAIGAVLANFIGTTGAAMLLIRPMMRANKDRVHKKHIFIFLIFIVCNTAGLLTPIGDPPLFLGFLRGVPFEWTLIHLWPQWILVQVILFVVFFAMEMFFYKKEPASAKAPIDKANREPLRIHGAVNFIFLIGVIATVYLAGRFAFVEHEDGTTAGFVRWWMRDLVLVILLLLSLFVGPKVPRQRNQFSWAPIGEVAIVFAGIFASMIPALRILEARGAELGITKPWQFYWLSGALSSFLDNAPTYLVFGSLTKSLFPGQPAGDSFHGLVDTTVATSGPLDGLGYSPAMFLAAISCGAVMMGANSYIGNAPNFMVKAICEEQSIKMPNFFAYIGWALVILVPTFIIVTLVFFI